MQRKRLLVLGILPLLAVVALLFPSIRWKAFGWLAGETFYQGMPTSYWCDQARTCDSFPLAVRHTYCRNTADDSTLRQALQVLFGSNDWPADHPLLRGDPASVPVLSELLHDDDPHVKIIAARGLGNVGPGARSAVPELQRELHHQWGAVRQFATDALRRIEPE